MALKEQKVKQEKNLDLINVKVKITSKCISMGEIVKVDFWKPKSLFTPRTRLCAIYRNPLGCHVNLNRSDLFIYSSRRSVFLFDKINHGCIL